MPTNQSLDTIHDRMLQVRQMSGLSQGEFANTVGTSRSIISQIEIGKIKPSYDVLMNVSRQFRVSYRYLLEGADADRGKLGAADSVGGADGAGMEAVMRENKLLRDQVAALKELTETQRDLIERYKKA